MAGRVYLQCPRKLPSGEVIYLTLLGGLIHVCLPDGPWRPTPLTSIRAADARLIAAGTAGQAMELLEASSPPPATAPAMREECDPS